MSCAMDANADGGGRTRIAFLQAGIRKRPRPERSPGPMVPTGDSRMSLHLIVDFKPLNGAEFLAQAQRIVASLRDNPHFPEPWPPGLPSLDQLSEDVDSFGAAAAEPASPATLRVARGTLNLELALLGAYLQWAAAGDRRLLASTGYALGGERAP